MWLIYKNIGNHIKLSALHGRLHLFSMSKFKWIIKHIVSRLVIIHVGALAVMISGYVMNNIWVADKWPLMADSNLYIKIWINTLAGLGSGILFIGYIIGLIALLLMFIGVGCWFWDWK